ncbi:uncharacterized protein LOC136025072 isoform X2 [Artemia franciscana]|uniref:Uncharacterized protein n=1 Tax=Artemia franciscana TaxID=6661 RepID=A0AA88HMV2_ARTSF|nr:hypothetical protein QYM36_011778 [Artemia franciscana]KAK2713192.1 hypothetical protein QYM36_011778 [Artemia franciscana]KAK2713194.1 hypothetical protein QYM36_011778 [Artemia franciscana]KAK2713195.1 hypothetical protein QYM36_011778 [Artemia franciscana]KAK2713196.1 hypothetical protein QYM36_011778 [Artemia franciscana]
MADLREYFYRYTDDFELIKEFLLDIIDHKTESRVRLRHLQFLAVLIQCNLLSDSVKSELAKYRKFLILHLRDKEIAPVLCQVLCSIVSSNVRKWEIDLIRHFFEKTGDKPLVALLRQIQMVRPDLIPDTTLLNVRNPFLKLPKKMIDEAEFSSSNEINATFQRAYVESGPVAKIRRLDLLPEDPTYAEIRSRKEKEIAYVTQVKHFCEFMPLMPTLKLPNLVASCLREVNLHPVVAVKMSEPEKWQLNRWIYLTLECGLLDSRKRTGKDLAYLLRHLKRFVAGTGMDLPGIFVILAEFLLNWDGLTFRTELFNLLPYLPIQLAKFEDIKKGLLNPLVKMASYGDEAFKDETLRCIGQLIVRLRYKSHLEELNDPELVKKNSKKHYRLSAFFQYTCNLFLSGPGAGYPIFRRILAEYACIFDCETSTNLDRFSTVPVALISAIASSCHTDLFCCLCKLLNGYFAVLSESSDLPFQESLREIQSVLKGLFLPKNPRNLTKRICFFPVIAAYATKLNLSFKESCLKIDDSPDLLLPVLEEEAPFIYKLMISIYLSSK